MQNTGKSAPGTSNGDIPVPVTAIEPEKDIHKLFTDSENKVIGDDKGITFSVVLCKKEIKAGEIPKLFDTDGNMLCELHDDGTNGEAISYNANPEFDNVVQSSAVNSQRRFEESLSFSRRLYSDCLVRIEPRALRGWGYPLRRYKTEQRNYLCIFKHV